MLERISFGLFIAVLAWAPFPLGSNRAWSWSLLCLLVALCWLLWLVSVWARPQKILELAIRLWLPALFAILALCWSALQVTPLVPQSWAHPIWQLAADTLGRSLPATVSIAPWRTTTESMKLLAYAMALWLAFAHSARPENARTLLYSVVIIGSLYAFYAFILASCGLSQLNVVYGEGGGVRDITGPFVNHNSFATYAGLAALSASALLVETGWTAITIQQGVRRLLYSMMQYLFGRGIPYLVACVVATSAVIASGSRAGAFATTGALLVLLAIGGSCALRQTKRRWISSVGIGLVGGLVILFAINGDTLANRLDDIGTVSVHGNTRFLLWDAALRMIHDAPILGLGLGTYERAYPMYSDTMLSFIMDKTHNDYLELAAGWGIPASLLWWSAIVTLAAMCVRGIQTRHRDRLFPIVAVGATVLVGVHSLFDFSLQMPAVSLSYATVLGMGAAQSLSSRAAIAKAQEGSPFVNAIARGIAVLPVIVVVALASPRYIAGLAQEVVAPATTRMATNTPLPPALYSKTASLLSHAAVDDGEGQILRAEAMRRVGAGGDVREHLEAGLALSPATARGWLLYSDIIRQTNPAKAYAAYSLSLLLAPHDYYLLVPRVVAGAPLWGRLSQRERQWLIADMGAALSDPHLSSALHQILTAEGGPALVTRTFRGHPEALRAFNRAMARQRLGI